VRQRPTLTPFLAALLLMQWSFVLGLGPATVRPAMAITSGIALPAGQGTEQAGEARAFPATLPLLAQSADPPPTPSTPPRPAPPPHCQPRAPPTT